MSVQIVPFKCPSCGKIDEGGSMVQWKSVGDISLYACKECQAQPMTEEQLLRVGIKAGWDAFRSERSRCDYQFKEPVMPDPSPFIRYDREKGEWGEWV